MSAIIDFNSQIIANNSTLAPIIFERGTDVTRSQQQAAQAFSEELARQAEETVEEVNKTEQAGIRGDADKKNGKQQQHKNRQRTAEEEKKDGWAMGADDDGETHIINIIA